MSCCDKSIEKPKIVALCPKCGLSCKAVAMRTLYHQVKFPENLKIVQDHYYFCRDKNCSIAYFSSSGQLIVKQDLRTLAEIENAKLCYCFDIDSADYTQALKSGSAEQIKAFVLQKTKAADCACAVQNPSGLCCLADFKRLEKVG